ncbi:dihydrodipicolinate synthase [Bacillus sp. SG-1]|nr:dihydrodipicolinate synthase [Bacillus sp. SG-1]
MQFPCFFVGLCMVMLSSLYPIEFTFSEVLKDFNGKKHLRGGRAVSFRGFGCVEVPFWMGRGHYFFWGANKVLGGLSAGHHFKISHQ